MRCLSMSLVAARLVLAVGPVYPQDKCVGQLKAVKSMVVTERGPIVQCLVGRGEAVVPEILDLLKDPNDVARLGATEALGTIAVKNPKKGIGFAPAVLPRVIEGLRGAANDAHPMVRMTALNGLSNIVNLEASS